MGEEAGASEISYWDFRSAGEKETAFMMKSTIKIGPIDQLVLAPALRSAVSIGTIGIGLGEAYTFSKETIALFQGRFSDFMTIRLLQ